MSTQGPTEELCVLPEVTLSWCERERRELDSGIQVCLTPKFLSLSLCPSPDPILEDKLWMMSL